MANQTRTTLKSAFFSLAWLANESHSDVVYHCFQAAREEAIRRQNFEVAAGLNDLGKILTNHYEPQPMAADELMAAAGL